MFLSFNKLLKHRASQKSSMEIKLTGTKIMIVNTSFNWLAYVWSVFQAFFFLGLIVVVPLAFITFAVNHLSHCVVFGKCVAFCLIMLIMFFCDSPRYISNSSLYYTRKHNIPSFSLSRQLSHPISLMRTNTFILH